MSLEPRSDLALVMPELAEIRSHIANLDYPGLAARMLALHDADQRMLADAAAFAAEEPSLHMLLAEQLRREGSDILAKALLAHGLIAGAWSIHGRLGDVQVTRDQVVQAEVHLREAEIHLIELCAVEPSWTYPWYLRLVTSTGLGLGISESRRRYERVAQEEAHHYPAQARLLQQLCPQWGGSWEAAFSFARACASSAGPGSPEHGIMADIHLRRWLDHGPKERPGYLRQTDVLTELRTAAEASVLHSEFQPGFGWVRLHTTFGVLFALAGEQDSAARHFAVLGEVVDADVWGCLAKDARVVQRARKTGLAKAGSA